MSSPIIFFCPTKQLSDDVKKTAAEFQEDVEVFQAWYPEALELARRQKSKNAKAIIALPVTAGAITGNVNIPVISLNPTSLDLLEAFSQARTYANEIAYIGFFFPALQDVLPRIEQFLGVRVQIFSYTKPDQREEIFQKALQSNSKIAVVTGDQGKKAVEQSGGTAVVVPVGRFAILQALRIARQVIASKEEEVKQRHWLELVLDSTHDGIIATNSEGKITTFNRTAEKCLGIPANMVLGINVRDLDPKNPVRNLLGEPEGGSSPREDVVVLQDKHLLVYRAFAYESDSRKQLIVTFKDESEIERLQKAVHRDAIRRGMIASYTFHDIVGKSQAIISAIETAKIYASTDSTILITGETGVGKEIFAQSIHNTSNRRPGPFVGVNCATIPENLLESELFGYEGGSFTGARKEGKRGLFEYANGGTIFLDEIGEMPLSLQARLLRVLQDKKEIRRVGGDKVIPVDVRVIAATNQNLQEEVRARKFRQDLYYRLNVLSLHVVPLRKRNEDIRELVSYFLTRKAAKYGKKPSPLGDNEIEALQQYDWPGNVRQLEGFIERYAILCEKGDFSSLLKELLSEKQEQWAQSEPAGPDHLSDSNRMLIDVGTMSSIERQILTNLLPKYGIGGVARKLGISRTSIWRKLKGDGSISKQ